MYKRSPQIFPNNKVSWAKLCLTCFGTTIILFTASQQSSAVKHPDGTVAFEAAVLLVDSYTTFDGIRVRQAIYYFDLELPEDVNEPLQKVVFQQRTGGDEIKFRPEKTKAYIGDHRNKDEQLNVVTSVAESGEIAVTFDQPIEPGNKVTIGLKPKENPDLAGVYLFGVTAFPAGEKPLGLYLGPGRLNFRRSSDSDFSLF